MIREANERQSSSCKQGNTTRLRAIGWVVERSEERCWCAELHRLRGVFLAALGADETEIEASFCEAIRIAKEQKSTPEILEGLAPEITSVKKIGCKSDSDKAYLCDVELEVKQFGSVTKGISPVRFVKASDGWAISK